MGQQTLRTVISIGGRVDNSFGVIGDNLLVLGSQVDAISQKVINFGKESLGIYASYDDAMREAQAAGRFNEQEMSRLDKLNREIARTTIYSNIEAASAMAELVKRGYELGEVEEMLPDVLNLAMAGNLSLADSVNYLGGALKALKEDADYADILVDMMARASDISAADINTIGDSITRLGSGISLFRGGAEEALTLITLLSDYGEDMRGTQGGTMLRNAALSLIAPAGQNAEVLAALENFGMDAEELNTYMEDEEIAVTAAAAAIDKLGLKVFDADGRLRSFYDILVDLDKALHGLPDEEKIPVLRSIFGKRGYTTIENLLNALPDYLATYNELINSQGAADERSAIMQGGIGGAMREWAAAYEEFKTSIGGQIAPEAQAGIELLTGFVSDLSGMDETKLAALVGAGEALALVGPGLTITGGAFRLIGSIFGGLKGASVAAGITLAAMSIVAAASAAEKANELDFEENFGLMEIDSAAINEKLNGISEAIDSQTEKYDKYRAAVEGAVSAYETASTTLSSELLSAAITGTTLSPEDQKKLLGLGNEMYNALVQGITNSSAASMEYFKLLFGGEGIADYDPAYQELYALLDDSYNDALETAGNLSQKLRDAMTAAFEDGEITPGEYDEILEIYRSINEAMAKAEAEAANEQAEIERRKMLERAGMVSFDSAEATLQEITAARDAELGQKYDQFQNEYYKAQIGWEKAIAEGREYEGELATPERMDASLAAMQEGYGEFIRPYEEEYDEMFQRLFDTLMLQGGYSDAWADIQNIGTFDGATDEEIARYMATQLSNAERGAIQKLVGDGRISALLEESAAGGNATAQSYLDMIGRAYAGSFSANEMINKNRITGQSVTAPDWMTIEPTVEMPDGREAIEPELAAAQKAADENPIEVYVDFKARNHQLNLPGMGSGSGHELTLPGMDTYATGGRATIPSIFGDAGAEWAIPEEHSQNTAELLDAARQASGFSWPDLISRTGGSGGSTIQLIYSPAIYAMDARDVEQKLQDDKARLERWLDEKKLRDEIEVYR